MGVSVLTTVTIYTRCNTAPHYIAPEIIKENPYSYPADWWSLGVVTYEMIIGLHPFDSNDMEDLYKKIAGADLRFKGDISPDAKVTTISQRMIFMYINNLRIS